MTVQQKTNGTIMLRRSNRDKAAALESINRSIARCNWTSLKVEEDRLDEHGIWNITVRVLVRGEG